MADNTQLSTASGVGDKLVTKEVSHSGDTSKLQGVSLMGVSGSEGAYTIADINGDATNGLDVDVTRIQAGDNTIGRVKISDGTDVALVDGSGNLNVVLSAGTNTNEVVGDVAQDAAVGGNPVLMGGRASAAAPTDMSADGDAVYLWTTLKGALHVADGGGTLSIDDGGGAITVDGTVGVSGTVTVDGSGVTQPVSNAGLTALNGAIAGTEVQVDVVAALPAGTNAIGKLAANSGVDIGDVDVTSVVPGTGATNLGKAEDAAHTTGDVGVMALTVRQDTAAALGGTDADYQPLITDASGRLHVNVGNTVTVASHAVTNAGTFAVQVDGNALTALQLIDDTIFADDSAFTPASSKVSAAGFLADDTAPDSVDEGDIGIARMTLDRSQYAATMPVSGTVYENGIRLSVKRAIIDAATSGDNTLVAAVTNKKIRVLSAFMVSAGTVTVRFESGAGGTALTGQMNLVANTGFVLPHNDHGWFETADSTLLNLELSGAISVDGCLTYIEAE